MRELNERDLERIAVTLLRMRVAILALGVVALVRMALEGL